MSEPKKKRLKLPLLLFIILILITVLLCAAAFGIWLYGRRTMTTTAQAPQLPQMTQSSSAETESAAEEEPPAEEEDTPVLLDEYTIQYNGKAYRYNEDMCNILLLGIDSDTMPTEPLPYGSSVQADVLVLAALDLRNDELTLISINRDTMCDIEILDEAGDSLGFSHSQIALSYAYGDGLQKSCQLTCNAVSDLFYGLQIHGYGAFYLGGVAELNDVLGGITVNILDDVDFTSYGPEYWNMVAGQEVTLAGFQARTYIQARQLTSEGNTLRMRRQKQYMLELFSQALGTIKENPMAALSIYDAVDDYILTDLNLSRISYLASEAASMSFDGSIRSLTGTSVLGDDSHMELTLDQKALYQLMLNVFYEEVTS